MTIQIPETPNELVHALRSAGYESYVVGGCVRDALMGRTPKDWDICTQAMPEAVLRVFAHKNVAKTGLQHGTVMVIDGGEGYEITTFRTDGDYSDHRHPDSVTFVRSLDEDLARRDFTINAMAYSEETGVIDRFGGREDMAAGLIRCVGDPCRRFEEDGLRILRALRFAARFGFAIEEETGRAMHQCRHLLRHIASERIFTELKGFLVGEGVCPLLLEYRDIMGEILPQLIPMFDLQQHNPHHCYDVWTHTAHSVEAAEPETVLRLIMLMHDSGKPRCFTMDDKGIGHFYGHGEKSYELAGEMLHALRCDNQTEKTVRFQIQHHDTPLPQTRKSARRFLRKMGREGALLSLKVHHADLLAQAPDLREEKLARLEQAKKLVEELMAEENCCCGVGDLNITGRDLMALGFPKGKAVGQELNRLLELVINEECPNDHEALVAQVQLPKQNMV